MVAAPPVAQGEGRQHPRHTGQTVIILHGGGVVMAVAKEVHIGAILAAGEPSLLRHAGRSAVVDDREAVNGAQAVLQGASTIHAVQSGGGALQILQGLLAVMPSEARLPQAADTQTRQPLTGGIIHRQRAGVDGQHVAGTGDLRCTVAKASAEHHRGGIVGESALLNTDKPGGNNGDAHIAEGDNILRIRRSVDPHAQVFRQIIGHGNSSFCAWCLHYSTSQRGKQGGLTPPRTPPASSPHTVHTPAWDHSQTHGSPHRSAARPG